MSARQKYAPLTFGSNFNGAKLKTRHSSQSSRAPRGKNAARLRVSAGLLTDSEPQVLLNSYLTFVVAVQSSWHIFLMSCSQIWGTLITPNTLCLRGNEAAITRKLLTPQHPKMQAPSLNLESVVIHTNIDSIENPAFQVLQL